MKQWFVLSLFLCLGFTLRAAFPEFDRPESWRKNSSGTLTVTRAEEEKALRFDVEFKAGTDFWAYPEVKLPEGIPADIRFLSFEIRIDQRQPEAGYKCALVMFGKGGSAQWQPAPRWQRVVIDLDKSNIKRAEADVLRIGANPKSPNMTFFLRNVMFLREAPATTGALTAKLVEAEAPAALFLDGEKPRFTVRQPIPGLRYELLDRHNRTVGSGPVPGDGRLTVDALPRGYYRMTLQAPDRLFQGERSFAVVPDPATRRKNPDSPYAMDAALNVIGTVGSYPGGREKGVRFFVELARLAGVEFARERIHQNGSETAPGVYDWKRFDLAPAAFSEAGIGLTATWHATAPWALGSKDGTLPRDLATAYSFGKKLAETFRGKVGVWEFWNEPELDGFCKEGAWEFAAMSKAAWLGFKAGDPDIPVANGSFCQPADGNAFAKAALRNDLAGYFDLFNYHIYGPLNTYSEQIADWRKLLGEYGLADMPIWITENGTNAEGVAAEPAESGENRAHSPAQEMVWAEFVPKGQLLLQSLGVNRNFTFVLPPMNEREGQKEWGLLRRDYSAKPAFVSFATLTDRLSAARYLGQPDTEEGIRAFLFRQPDGSHTLAFWSESELDVGGNALSGKEYRRDFSIPAQTAGTLTDVFGAPSGLAPENGRIRLTATRYPAYFTGDFTLPVKVPPVGAAARSGLNGLDKSIVLRAVPSADFALNQQRNLLLLSSDAKERKLKLQIANFSNETKRGKLTVEGEIAGLPGELELKPFEIREIELEFPAWRESRLFPYRFGGIFNNRSISRLELPVLYCAADSGKPLAGTEDTAKWRKNSSGELTVSRDETERAIRFDVKFAPGVDRWVYPEFLPECSLDGLVGLSFEIKTLPQADRALHLVMLVEGNETETGKRYNIPYRISPGEWRENFLWLSIDSPEKIRQLRIGMNPRTDQTTFWVRNIRVHFAR